MGSDGSDEYCSFGQVLFGQDDHGLRTGDLGCEAMQGYTPRTTPDQVETPYSPLFEGGLIGL